MAFKLTLFSPFQWSDHKFQVAVALYFSDQHLGHLSDLSSTMMPPGGTTVEKQRIQVKTEGFL